MRFACLGSGSRGNATLVEEGGTRVLIDCGFSLRETTRRLARLDLTPDDLTAVLVTHEHSDHVNGVARLAMRHGLPVYATAGTARGGALEELDWRLVCSGQSFGVADLHIEPVAVPHDALEPCQYVFSNGNRKLGVLTDCGSHTDAMLDAFSGCHGLVLECNHDPAMLAAGPYPAALRRRVGGADGHLSNQEAAEFLATIDHGWLQHLVAAHLSETNNLAHLARTALAAVMNCTEDLIDLADQQVGLSWRSLHN